MNVIAKIICYLERGVVTLKLRKEYLNSVTHTTSVLLRIKYWTVWCIERYSMSTYTGVTNCQKTVRFFLAHPVYVCGHGLDLLSCDLNYLECLCWYWSHIPKWKLRFPEHQISCVSDWVRDFSPWASSAMYAAKETKFAMSSCASGLSKRWVIQDLQFQTALFKV